MSSALLSRAEQLSNLLPPLLIEAECVADSVWLGAHGRRRSGRGESFWQYRRYDQGDPAARIDWRQSARTDKLYVREQEWEAMQSACLWADMSGSMQYASDKNLPTKADQAQLLMLALASLLMRGGEKVLWSHGQDFRTVQGKIGLEEIAGKPSLDPSRKGGREAPMASESLPPYPPTLRHAHIVFASDFLMPLDELQSRLQAYTAHNLRGVLLHIIDPLEESFALDGRVELLGAEGEAPHVVPNAASLRDAYRQRFTEHQNQLRNFARSAGWFYLGHVTSNPPQQDLMQLYHYLAG